jgi:hypothetical protein
VTFEMQMRFVIFKKLVWGHIVPVFVEISLVNSTSKYRNISRNGNCRSFIDTTLLPHLLVLRLV